MNHILSDVYLYIVSSCRKLLKEDQLEAGTKTAQQEEMDRRKRLEQQRKEFPAPAPVVPDSQLGDWLTFCDLANIILCVFFFLTFFLKCHFHFPSFQQ